MNLGHESPVNPSTNNRVAQDGAKESERIAKVIARAGLCSRRDAERWIADGRVSVNGNVLTTPAFTVGPDDKIVVDGRPLPASEAPRLFLYHKPAGLVTTARDENNRLFVSAALVITSAPNAARDGRFALTRLTLPIDCPA